jgi:amino acid transporter
MSDDIKEAASRKASKATFLQTLSAVLWSFFGVRKGANHSEDMQKLNPVHVIIVGVLAAAAFVLGLLTLVNFVVGSA